jgi:subtilisin family serine protease
MFKISRVRSHLLALALLCVSAVSARCENAPAVGDWMPGEVILKIRASAFSSPAYQPNLLARGRTGIASVDAQLARLETTSIRNVFNSTTHASRKHDLGMDRILLAHFASAVTPPEASAALGGIGEVEWAEPNGIGHGTFTPNDPTYRLQWAHNNHGQAIDVAGDSVGTPDCDVDTNQAWGIQTGAYNVVIAVIDTGIDRGHPEFANKVLAGWDFVNNDSDPNDDNGHGTSCSGIAAAIGNNGQGVAGVDWGAAILPVKVMNSNGQGSTTDLANGIEYAADFGAQILSMSVEFGDSQTLHDAVTYAWNTYCAMFAAAGNENRNSLGYPAAYPEAFGVGALSPCNERKSPTSCDGETNWGSNYGAGLRAMAPGVRIHTTDIRGSGGYSLGDYTSTFNGTSAATPFVAGVAGLVLSQSYMTPVQLYALLQTTCDNLGPPGWDQETGNGRINAYAALRSVTGAVFVGSNSGVEHGTYDQPYRTVAAGVNAATTGNYLVIKPGNYDEANPLSIGKVIHVDAIDGGVTIH